jgi:hypothetical protein
MIHRILIAAAFLLTMLPIARATDYQTYPALINGAPEMTAPASGDRVGVVRNPMVGYATTQWMPAAQLISGPTVANTTALRASCTLATGCPAGDLVFAGGVIRLTYGNGNGAPPLYFSVGTGACSTDDGASCVNSANGKSWLGQFSASGADVREWGAKCDGATDDTTAIEAALTAAAPIHGTVQFPSKTCFSATGIVAGAPVNIQGTNFNPISPSAGGISGGSELLCYSGVNCLTVNAGSNLAPSQIVNLIIAGVSGTPAAGTIGLYLSGGAQINLQNVQVSNFDTCALAYAHGSTGIAFDWYYPVVYQCGTHFFNFDGWPEAKIFGGRIGSGSDYDTAQDMVLFSKTGTLGGGGGPNSVRFIGTNFVTGGSVQCFVRWADWTGSGGVQDGFHFENVHFESHKDGDADFCSDATVPVIADLTLTNVDTSTFNSISGSYWLPLFDLNPVTALNGMFITSSNFDNCTGGASQFVLSPTPASGPSFNSVHLNGNTFCTGPTFNANSSTNFIESSGNQYGGLNITGVWSDFESAGDNFVSMTSATATGTIGIAGAHPQSFTPVLRFGGTPSLATYSSYGFY